MNELCIRIWDFMTTNMSLKFSNAMRDSIQTLSCNYNRTKTFCDITSRVLNDCNKTQTKDNIILQPMLLVPSQ